MSFASISFLYRFLPAVLALYQLAPRRYRNHVLLLASLVFYFFGEPSYTALLAFSAVSGYLHGLYIEKRRNTPAAKAALLSAVAVSLLTLGFYKYADFFLGLFNALTGSKIPPLHIPLPVGISFFTFQTISYTIDVYRGRVRARRGLITLATYVCLFPQLVAGPIVRYEQLAAELDDDRRCDTAAAASGVRRFVFGLSKKVLLANTMGALCAAFRSAEEQTVLFYWLYAAAFTLQIYFDFSGYSDMAVGLGRLFGFTFPENFDYPYTARSVTAFWRRWHMTLGGWFRDYLYIPLGGNRVSRVKWLRNVAAVWLLTGLWHGAAWNFVVWGAFFGVLLIAERLWLGQALRRAGRVLPHLYVMTAVVFGFVVFNADGLSGAAADLGGMLGFGGIPFSGAETLYYLRGYAVSLALAALGATPLPGRLAARAAASRAGARLMAVLEPPAVALLLLAATAYLVDGSFNPFLYFRF